eukprot:530345-Ditylum_brightwellii.AAC.1
MEGEEKLKSSVMYEIVPLDKHITKVSNVFNTFEEKEAFFSNYENYQQSQGAVHLVSYLRCTEKLSQWRKDTKYETPEQYTIGVGNKIALK